MAKTLYRVDYLTSATEIDFYYRKVKELNSFCKAKEEVRKIFGFGTVYIIASNRDNAERKFYKRLRGCPLSFEEQFTGNIF